MFFSSSGNKADDLPFLTDFYLVLCLLNLEKETTGCLDVLDSVHVLFCRSWNLFLCPSVHIVRKAYDAEKDV